MSTPEGESFVSDGTHSAGAPVQWGTPQEHAACNEAIRAAAAFGAHNALLSLADALDRKAADQHAEAKATQRLGREASARTITAMGRTYEVSAAMARRRAESGQPSPSGSPGLSQDTREGQERTEPLSAADAYMAGVKAERERVVQLAEDRQATYDLTKPCGCGRTHPGTGRPCTALIRSGQPFADLIREGGNG